MVACRGAHSFAAPRLVRYHSAGHDEENTTAERPRSTFYQAVANDLLGYNSSSRKGPALVTIGTPIPGRARNIGPNAAALAPRERTPRSALASQTARIAGCLQLDLDACRISGRVATVRLPAAAIQTNDLDVAQFADVSAAIGDATRPMLDVPRRADASFRPVPHIDPGRAVSYMAESGLRVDFLTPNRGRDSDAPRNLPALGTDGQQLRFLDFLIRDPEPAVLLHGAGVLVSVPAPQRFALHKPIVARRRAQGNAKRDKDLMQAQALLDAIVERRPYELRAAWTEAFQRGKTWRRLLGEGLGLLRPNIRDAC